VAAVVRALFSLDQGILLLELVRLSQLMIGFLQLGVPLAILFHQHALENADHLHRVAKVTCVLGAAVGCHKTSVECRSHLITGGLHALPPSPVALVPDGEQV
jgi:hypothetical protein